jgi:hypothetical protein
MEQNSPIFFFGVAAAAEEEVIRKLQKSWKSGMLLVLK